MLTLLIPLTHKHGIFFHFLKSSVSFFSMLKFPCYKLSPILLNWFIGSWYFWTLLWMVQTLWYISSLISYLNINMWPVFEYLLWSWSLCCIVLLFLETFCGLLGFSKYKIMSMQVEIIFFCSYLKWIWLSFLAWLLFLGLLIRVEIMDILAMYMISVGFISVFHQE